MPHKHVILAIDEGTSGTRAATVSADGQVSHLEYQALHVETPRPGVVEQDANVILEKTIEVCRSTIAQAQREGLSICAMAIATQRATAVLWDTQSGRALVPAMVWMDTRFVDELNQMAPEWDTRLLERVGRPVGVRSLLLWCARHLRDTPAVAAAWRERRLAFGTVDTWLLWNFSQRRECVTTPTNAASFGSYVLAENKYYSDWVQELGFPLALLPALRQDADDFGHTRPEVLGIDVPILASAGDQHAGAVGLGCLDRGQAMCVHGTGSFVDLIVGTDLPVNSGVLEGTLTMMARRQDGVSHFAVETFVATTGAALNWVCEKLKWFKDAREISGLAATVKSSQGVTFVPALTGLRVPHMEAGARASLTGISMATTQAEVAYAILEGIAHSVASCIEADEKVSGVQVHELVVGGGLARSDVLLQMQADLIGIPIRRLQDADRASLRGVAYLAGSSGLLWPSLHDARKTIVTEAVFEPAIGTPERTRRRALWHARVASELAHVALFKQENQEALET